ncbi:MAG: DUF3108 domain-containing protein [Bdellovibrionales bacterium]|nr:DUF3108 domain-containing protein [Bdellovibrionales bacterium]
MKNNWNSAACGFVASVALIAGCSSSSNLKKFDDGDISKEISADIAKKFEVKDVAVVATPGTTATATPKSTPVPKRKKGKETKVSKALEVFAWPASRRLPKMPFEIGEKLEYDIRFIGIDAAHLNVELLPPKMLGDRQVYHISAHAKTAKLFELVYRVDDRIESFWDYDGLFSHKFMMDLDESKQSRKLIELYDYEKKKSFFWNRVDHVEKGLSEQKEQYDIALWSQDPISSLYYLRIADLPKNPAKEFRYPVIIDGKPWESVLKFQKQEKIYAGGKDFTANVYSLDNYQNGELKNKDNKVWISDDEHRYVLRIEAKVKVGSFAIALNKIL